VSWSSVSMGARIGRGPRHGSRGYNRPSATRSDSHCPAFLIYPLAPLVLPLSAAP
jgi:hypothetical protein